MSGAIKPRGDEQAQFIATYAAHRDGGMSGDDARAAMMRAWQDAGRPIGRATLYRWLAQAEDLYSGTPRPPKQQRAAPTPAVAAPSAPPPPEPPPASHEPGDGAGDMLRISHMPIGDMLAEILTTFQACMRYATGPDLTRPRNPMLALRAAGGLSTAIQTSLAIHKQFHDAARMEQFTGAIMDELRAADPKLARRVMARLDALAQSA